MNVYLNEFNIVLSRTNFLPYASGLLAAYCKGIEGYNFMPFVFTREKHKYVKPRVMGFSVSMWNEQYSLSIAKRVASKFKDCTIIFGGLQVSDDYLSKHDSIDVIVRGDGEQPFYDILTRLKETKNLEGISNVTWRHKNKIVNNGRKSIDVESLDVYPSPYTTGLFDYLLDNKKEYQAILETNRGCPFGCAYCGWGVENRKMFFHSLDYVKKDIEWFGKNKINYIFNADSNFGIVERDQKIADIIIRTKGKYGYPQMFRNCFSKTSQKRTSRIINKFVKSKIDKGITLSFQSMDKKVNENIGRINIEINTYKRLLNKFNKKEIPVYTELILGLPGETVDSFVEGIEKIIEAGLKGQLFIYICEVYPNTKLADKNYQKKFGIVTKNIILASVHSTPTKVKEYQDIVISTNSMSLEDWKFMLKFSWITQLLFSMKVGIFIMEYLRKEYGIFYTVFLKSILKSNIVESLDEQIDEMLTGKSGRCVILKEFGEIHWEMEEAEFLKIASNPKLFYDKLTIVIINLLNEFNCKYVREDINDIVSYQMSRIPKMQDKKEFAKRVVLWGRKSNKILNEPTLRKKLANGKTKKDRENHLHLEAKTK